MPSVAARFQKPKHTPPAPDKLLPIPFAKVGIEIEVENCNRSRRELTQDFPNWSRHEDENSLRNYGMEFVSPDGGIMGAQLRPAIEDFCVKAKELSFSEGYPRAGIHFHIDVTDMNEKSDTELLNMILAYMMFEHVFFAFAGEWRRACGFCDPLLSSQGDYPAISSLLYGWKAFDPGIMHENSFSKYSAINFLPLNRFGTVEIRHLPTTFDSDRIIDWLKLSLCLKRYGMKVDKNPVEVLNKEGPDALIKLVFKGCEKLVKKYVNVDLLWLAVPEIMSLKIMRNRAPFDPWADPDNPLLEIKRLPKPAEPDYAALTARELHNMYSNETDPNRRATLGARYLARLQQERRELMLPDRPPTTEPLTGGNPQGFRDLYGFTTTPTRTINFFETLDVNSIEETN